MQSQSSKSAPSTTARTARNTAISTVLSTALLVTLLVLVACAPVPPTATSTVAPTTEADDDAATSETASTDEDCATLPASETVVVNHAAGYCFLIPPGYTIDHDLVIYAPDGTEGHRERAIIDVTPATGRTAAQLADALLADLTGFEITRTTIELDGSPAEVLDQMPGQDLNRRVIAVANDRAYSLMFMPLAPAEATAATAQMEELYAGVIDSFRFLTPETAAAPAESEPRLTWQGEIDGACHVLHVWADGLAQAGVCGDSPTTTAELLSPAVEWAAIQTHFGTLDQIATPHGTIAFTGTGPATGEPWANALAVWAEFAAMETISGRPSAAGRTTLAWQLGQIEGQPDRCAQLIVLAYGWAYANQIPCDGNGPGTQIAQDWLTDAELATFTTWTRQHSRVDDAAGYLDANGDAPLTAAEVNAFSADTYARLVAAATN